MDIYLIFRIIRVPVISPWPKMGHMPSPGPTASKKISRLVLTGHESLLGPRTPSILLQKNTDKHEGRNALFAVQWAKNDAYD